MKRTSRHRHARNRFRSPSSGAWHHHALERACRSITGAPRPATRNHGGGRAVETLESVWRVLRMEARRTLNFFFTDAAVLNMGKAKSAGKLAAKAAKKVKQEKVSTYCLTRSLRIAELQSRRRREDLRMWMRYKKRISTHCLRNIALNGRRNTLQQRSTRILYPVDEQMRH